MTDIIAGQALPCLSVPSEKEKKYDRQLRLWAASGQAALESANVLLVNSGSGTIGVETLKNLVLPGIGKFTIADDTTVTEADLGVNFFLDESSLGKSRAQCCTELLLELNPEVEGDWHPRNSVSYHRMNHIKELMCQLQEQETLELGEVLGSDSPFTIILYALPIRPEHLNALESYSRERKTPLIAIHSAGFYAYFRLRLPGVYPIVDTHPDAIATTDLRLLTPWEELTAFAENMTKDIDGLDNHEHGHLPFVVILLHYLKVWRSTHADVPPTNYKEKVEFRKMVANAARVDNAEGGEENFEEAVAAVLKTISQPSLPSAVKQVFEYQHTNELESTSSFWVIAAAVRSFYEKHKCLPLPGGLPDMKAQSSVYIKLQNIYKDKARKDAAEVLSIVRQNPCGESVDPAEVDMFCKNAAFIKLIIPATDGDGQLRSVAQQEFANDELAKDPSMPMPLSLLPIYLALHATSHTSSATPDAIMASVQKILPDADGNKRVIEAAHEVSRARGGELHNVSATAGGMVAQETIKIITNQYIPIENTCIFDGIGSRTQVLRF
ncbi:NEDD8-activating enzyme E1 regulatory subunit [Colletotrichum fructicola]|uniref:NEDD8-activating enzyme E1 regulatory subunit n=1 Tax=Colletotrichum fructicola (strain Nara gc5) TaxID=1213859 RepID=L2FHW5_COLFN|nr:NEDD8-activating enzyme E1 regulatory subunit [Colletotrichum fructicola]KAF4893141.1 NEDD8-activating enzyme E1 regulatory subunit [Colletotrichum fructicola]KAF4927863.1 NEDD8-activating enzyme E1 regulatory subunit [Colletotrichum fructicola]KAI8285340.1 NEDD8-activating enzyme E1 regulatory subunit [Colletotrichum sp. SAR11_57]